jgi:hypothetical protein
MEIPPKNAGEIKIMKNKFETKDMYIAAMLYSLGLKLDEVKRDGRRCWFIFSDREKCEKLQQQYLSKSLRANLKEYADSIRTLKDIVFT